MIARRTVLLAAAISTALGLVACHKKDEATSADPQAVAAAQTALSAPAWLRQHLPAQTVAYIRIPSPWGMLNAVPNGRPLDAALSAKAHLDAIASVRTAIAKDKLLADTKVAPALNLLLGDLRSPLEVAILDPLGIPSPSSRVVATAVLDFADVGAFNARLASLTGDTALLAAPLDAQGNGMLSTGATAVHFDAAQHRLWIASAVPIGKNEPMDANGLAALTADITKASATTAPPLLAALEARIDTSGEGLFGWVTVRGVGAVAAAQAGDSPLGKLPADFAAKADAIAFGAGTVNGRGQAQFLIHAPQARMLGYAAPTSFAPTFKTVGEAHWAFTFASPTAEAWKTMVGNLNLDFGPDAAKKITAFGDKMEKRLHMAPTDYFSWFGPEYVLFADDAGTYTAVRVRDWKAWHDRLEKNAQFGWKTGTVKVDGTEVHWLTAPNDLGDEDVPPDTPPALKGFMQLFQRTGGRAWWTEEGDWAVFSKVPQALSDRAAAGPDASMDDWFKAHGYPGQRTVAGFTATSHGAQRDAYYTYLSILQFLQGVSGSDGDISALPSAHSLGLPDKGVIGAGMEVDKETLGFSVTYEQSPVEILGVGGGATGLATVATAGILAAIAIPQYENYTIRAQVSSAETDMEAVKTAVAEHRLTTGKFPATNAAAGLGKPETLGGDYLDSIEIGPGGEIVGNFSGNPPHKANPKLDGGQLILTPVVEGKAITWRCSAEAVEPQYLPVACRDEPIGP
jgi:hypothetical protein